MGGKRNRGLVRSLDDIPERPRGNLRPLLAEAERVLLSAPTEYRSNPDMPFAWLVITSRQLILCNSHRTRGVYASHPHRSINQVRLEGARLLRILLNDSMADILVPLPDALTIDEVRTLLDTITSCQVPSAEART